MSLTVTAIDANEVHVEWTGLDNRELTMYRSTVDYTSSPGTHIADMTLLGDVTGKSEYDDYTTVRGNTYYYYVKHVSGGTTGWETGSVSTANKPGEILPSNVPPHSFMATTDQDVFINLQNGYGKHTTAINLSQGKYTLVLIKSTSGITDREMAKILDKTTVIDHKNDEFRIITNGDVNAVTGYASTITVTDHVTYAKTGA